ncbi:MAG: hypothetical protein ABUS56_13195, partial [Acidobacteriota bacterium]
EAFAQGQPSDDVYSRTLAEIREQLVTRHHFPLTRDDLHDIEVVLHAFYAMGPQIRYSPIGSSGGTVQPTYAELMTATDESGATRSFLADDATFRAVQDFERRNLLVPVVGNFAGPRSLRAIGQYLKRHALTVSAFYLSNVEEYLIQDGIWGTFCANAATLPLTQTSTFIRSVRTDGPTGTGTAFRSQLRSIREEVKDCSETPRW